VLPILADPPERQKLTRIIEQPERILQKESEDPPISDHLNQLAFQSFQDKTKPKPKLRV